MTVSICSPSLQHAARSETAKGLGGVSLVSTVDAMIWQSASWSGYVNGTLAAS